MRKTKKEGKEEEEEEEECAMERDGRVKKEEESEWKGFRQNKQCGVGSRAVNCD